MLRIFSNFPAYYRGQYFHKNHVYEVSQKVPFCVKWECPSNCGPNCASLYIRVCYKDFFFQTLQHDKGEYVDHNHWSESSKKIFLAEWAIFIQFSPKIMQTYISGFTLTILFKLCLVIEDNTWIKITWVKFLKKYLVQEDSICSIVTQSYDSLYVKICSRDFFQTSKHGKGLE